MFILSSYLGVPVPEDVLGRLGAVPHHAGQVQVVSLLQENVGAAENLSYRLYKGIINNRARSNEQIFKAKVNQHQNYLMLMCN